MKTAPVSLVGPETLAELLSIARQTPVGCFVEVGVYQGGSAWHLNQLAREQGRELYLYDTFTGIPHRHSLDSHQLGDFADTSYEAVRERFPNCSVIAGIFPGSAVPMPPVAFAHVDCDQYQSVKETAAYLIPRMVTGGVMWFDDSPCLNGAHEATRELFGDRLRLAYNQKHFVEF